MEFTDTTLLEMQKQLQQLNHKLCGRRLTALELADLMTSIGMEKGSAVRCVNAARSPRDATRRMASRTTSRAT